MVMRKSFSIHSDFYEELAALTTEQQGTIMLALIKWACGDKQIELDPICAMLLRLMTAQMERISAANVANGAKGGRPQKASETEKSEINEKSQISEDKRIKPSVTDAVSASVPVSTSVPQGENGADAPKPSPPDKTGKSNKTDKNADKTKRYGQYKQVILSDEAYVRLKDKLGAEILSEHIDIVDYKIETKGYKWKNHELYIERSVKEGWSIEFKTAPQDSHKNSTNKDYGKSFY